MSGVTAMENLSIKIRRMFGAKKPPDEQRLMVWYEDALDLENACLSWEKAAELLRSNIRKAAKESSVTESHSGHGKLDRIKTGDNGRKIA